MSKGDNLYGEIERRKGVGHVEDGVVITYAVIRNHLIKEIDICTKFPRGKRMDCISWLRVFQKEKRQVQNPEMGAYLTCWSRVNKKTKEMKSESSAWS